MFLPYIQKTQTLAILALAQVLLLCFVKLSSSALYNNHLEAQNNLDEMIISICGKPSNEIDLEECNLLGKINTPYTSTSGDEYSKRITLKKIFSNVFIHYFNDLGIGYGDTVAVGMTGSFPGASLAMHSACNALGIHPIVISSIGSSAYGANTEDLLILDIENILFNEGKIAKRSTAVSLGGKNDRGGYLIPSADSQRTSDSSRYNYIAERINELDIELINHDSLTHSIAHRMDIYNSSVSNSYKAYINIGGGIASLGVMTDSSISFPSGIISEPHSITSLDGVINKFLDNNIPAINIQNITTIQDEFDIDPGSYIYNTSDNSINEFIRSTKLNPYIAICAWFLSVISIIFIGYQSFKQIKERMKDIEPESLL